MKTKLLALSIGIVAASFLSGLGNENSAGQSPQWKGKIETVDGIKIVHNAMEPLYGEIKLDLEEDLKIGRADDDNFLFYRVRGIDVDKDGNIYVADMSNYRIQKFDKSGKYALTFGRQGQGPGEFDLPTNVRIEEKMGNVLVKDQAYTIEFFSPEGKPLKSIRLEHGYYDFRVTPEGTILAVMGTESELQMTQSLCKIDAQARAELTYAQFPYNLYMQKMGESVLSISTGHELALHFNLLDPQSVVYGHSKEYELMVSDLGGKVLYRIKKDEPYPKFTDTEKKNFRKIPLPEFKPYFYALFVDDLGRIYVQRNQADFHVKEDVQKEVDVFSKDGYFLYRTRLPKETFVIRNGCLYALEVKDDEVVKRYKIKNWDSLKSGL
jgi:hypothetical protein